MTPVYIVVVVGVFAENCFGTDRLLQDTVELSISFWRTFTTYQKKTIGLQFCVYTVSPFELSISYSKVYSYVVYTCN